MAARRPKVARSVKQPVLIAVTVPASPTSDTKPARKLLDAIGRRPTTKPRKPSTAKQRTPRAKPARKPRRKPRAKPARKSRRKPRAKPTAKRTRTR